MCVRVCVCVCVRVCKCVCVRACVENDAKPAQKSKTFLLELGQSGPEINCVLPDRPVGPQALPRRVRGAGMPPGGPGCA